MAEQNILVPPSGYNTYVGARYVPVFDGEWNSTKKYEPLVVVMYQGNSYTSRTWVPAGVLPTNDAYWALSGNYNAQIQEYLETLQKYIDIVSKMSINNVIIIGDSYANGTTDTSGIYTTSFALLLKKYLPNVTFYQSSKGGTGFSTEPDDFLSLLTNIQTSIPDPDSINMILVCGGCNDIYSTVSNIEKGISNFVNYANNTYKNARISIGCIGHYTDQRQANLIKIVLPAYQTAAGYGAEFIPDSEYLCASPWYIGNDFTHPNQQGQNSIAFGLYNFIKNGSSYIQVGERFSNVVDNDNFTWSNQVIRVIATNTGRNIRWSLYNATTNTMVCSFVPKTNIVFNQYYNIGSHTLFSNQTNGSLIAFSYAPCAVNIVLKNTAQIQVPGIISFSNGEVYMLLYASQGSAVINGNDVTRIEIRNVSYSVDACVGI